MNASPQDLKTKTKAFTSVKTKIKTIGMCPPQSSWDRFYQEYQEYLESLNLGQPQEEEDLTDEEDDSTVELEMEQVDDEAWFDEIADIPQGMLIATPEGSEWGDPEIDNLPSLDDFFGTQ